MGNTESGQQNLERFVPFTQSNLNNIEQFSVVTCINYFETDVQHAIIRGVSDNINSTSNKMMYKLWSEEGYFARPASKIGFFMGSDNEKKQLLELWKRKNPLPIS